MKKLMYVLFLGMALMACNSAKKATEPNLNEAPVLQRDVPEEVVIYRLSVSFVSIGGGTDQKAREKYNQYMAEYEVLKSSSLVRYTENTTTCRR